ncbi:alpha/beta-hydrolase family protein [Gordonia sp. CPCC 205333]|uniref:alpha/beta-hydrolase family protein n=1 Tax=Gordonia sp. CPCC 205333 TaxID=3140790 RepID=UPI003AF3517F
MKTPAVSTSLGALIGAAIGFYPGQLPRGGLLAGVVVAACVGLGTFVGLLIARTIDGGSARARRWTLVIAAGVFGVIVGGAAWWQASLRDALGVASTGPVWAVLAGLPAVVTFGVIALWPRLVAWTLALVGTIVVGYLSPGLAGATPQAASGTTGAEVAFFGALDSGRPIEQRAHDVVSRWVVEGGLTRRAVVVAVPTGSGWIDTAAVDGFRIRLGNDVPVLGLQYADVPSWRAFISDRDAAGRAAIALVAEVDSAMRDVEPDNRPKLVLYGQSLGALGADVARVWAAEHGIDVAQTIEIGVPGDSIPRRAAGRTVLANASDPVAQWSPNLLWRPARMTDDTAIIGRHSHRTPWLPIVSFLQTSVDLLGALDVPAGTGHRYGLEQGTTS